MEYGKWTRLDELAPETAAEPYELWWVAFKGGTEEGERALKAPLLALQDGIPDVGPDWQVVVTSVNAHRAFHPFSPIHFCQQWTLLRADKVAWGLTYKHIPEDAEK